VRTGSCRRRGGGPAAGARWRPTRAAAATAGLPPERLRQAPDGGKPEDIRPPATTSRARPQGAKGTPKPAPQGAARRGSRRAVVEAAGSVPSDEAGAREPRGRHRPADPKDPFSASPPRLFQGRGPPRACARGRFRARDISQRSPFGRGYVKATSKDCRRRKRRPCRARPRC
jgi:hypothetical protein